MKVILLYLRQQILNMDRLLANIKIQVNPAIYIKDPETTELGRKILTESIHLIDELGFDHFTFKKLGERIGSNERQTSDILIVVVLELDRI
jgi:hypothetical protein